MVTECALNSPSENCLLPSGVGGLLALASRSPEEGIGKPEPLKYGLVGAWSRRITQEHRLVYRVVGDDLQILQVRYHYA